MTALRENLEALLESVGLEEEYDFFAAVAEDLDISHPEALQLLWQWYGFAGVWHQHDIAKRLGEALEAIAGVTGFTADPLPADIANMPEALSRFPDVVRGFRTHAALIEDTRAFQAVQAVCEAACPE